MLRTFQCFSSRCPFSNNLSAFFMDPMQHFRVPFPQVFCVWSKSFGIFTNLMKHFRVHPKSRFHSFNILVVLAHRFLFVFLPSQTLLRPYNLRCSVCTKLFSSFIKLYGSFSVLYVLHKSKRNWSHKHLKL